MNFSEQASSFILKLFSTEGFPPRWYCGEWSAFHGWTYIISNVIIWLAYYLIPTTFIYIVIRRTDLPLRSLIIWFVAFIAFCGATHLMEAIIFWYPLYRFNGLLLMVTAIVSVVTVWKFYQGVPKILTLRTNQELEMANIQLRKSEKILRQQNEEIKIKNKKIQIHKQILSKSQQRLEKQKKKISIQNQELQQTNAIKDKIFSIVAHDLRSPINTLQGLLTLFQENNDFTQEEMKQYIIRTLSSATKLSGLLDNLLYWAKSQMNGISLSPTYLDISSYIEEVIMLFEETRNNKNIQIITNIEENTPQIYADPEVIRLLLRNLLNNAQKFSQSNSKIVIKVKVDMNHQIRVSIEDKGVGIDETTKNNLFKNFVKSKRGTNSEKGIGLGLTLCKEFVEYSRGSIGVESELGKGSVFWFTLPTSNDESSHHKRNNHYQTL